MASYLITGGAGFIGSHLADALIAAGHGVRILDDLSTGRRQHVPLAAELVVGDVADPIVVRRAMAGVAGCFHLAAIASVERCNRDWFGTHRVNLGATIAVLEAARDQDVPVVYASSAAVYGDNANLPLDEESAIRTISSYGADKRGCELHARAAGTVHGVRTAALRFFNVYGPRQDPSSPYSGVISIFCNRLKAGQEVTIFGDGAQTRDFVFVSDVVRAVIAAMDGASVEAPVFCICTGVPTSIRSLADTIGGLLGTRPRLRHAPSRPGDIRASIGSAARAQAVLGWTPRVSLADGLAATLGSL